MPYLHTIGLENFRLFKDRTTFELAPITILTGINNSGKSSLIKSLQLFKSSIKATGGLDELNFTGGRHNLGNFSQTLNNESSEDSIRMTFDFPLQGIREKTFIELEYSIARENQESGFISGIKIFTNLETPIISLKYDFINEVAWLLKIDIEFLTENFSQVFDEKYIIERDELNEAIRDPDKLNLLINPKDYESGDEMSIFESFFHERQGPIGYQYETPLRFELIKGFKELDEKHQREISERVKGFKERGVSLSVAGTIGNDLKIIEIVDLLITDLGRLIVLDGLDLNLELSGLGKYLFNDFLNEILFNAVKLFSKNFDSINSMSSVRANSERLYSNNSSIVDINSLLIDFSKINFEGTPDIEKFITRSLKLFKVGDRILIKRHQEVATEIFIVNGDDRKLLADMGFGFTQLVPIIIKIALIAHRNKDLSMPWESYSERLFLLEEPESNLHPSFQSKLAELIIDAAKTFNIQFIIETHSEYIIRNFQYLTATKQIPSNGTKIYYFNQPDSEDFKEAPYREIKIMSDGRLSNEFGEGFFDEIPRLLAFLYNSSFN